MFEDLDSIAAEMAAREMAREQVIANVLLNQEARKESLPAGTVHEARNRAFSEAGCVSRFRETAFVEEAESALKLDRLVGRIMGAAGKPKRKDVIDYYRAHAEEFREPEMAHAAHIVKNVDESHSEATALAEIRQLHDRLTVGADFATLADEHSDCPGDGGDLGWFARGQMVSEFDEVVFSAQAGGISRVFRTVFGFHIVRALERRASRIPTLEEVYDRLADDLYRARQQEAVERFVARLRASASIREVKIR
jgi:parvulin-like peptidyl-prolyl isomerase